MLRAPGARGPLPQPDLVFAIPGVLDTPTGGYRYARAVVESLRAQGRSIQVLDLGHGFPRPNGDQADRAYRQIARAAAGSLVLVDGLALGALPRIGEMVPDAQRLIALIHHPLALETGLSRDEAAQCRLDETRALAAVGPVIVSSRTTRDVLVADYGVAAGRIAVALPGTDPADYAEIGLGGSVRLVSVGTLTPRKGHDLMIDALAGLGDLDWSLIIAGDPTRDPAYAAGLYDQVQQAGLAEHIAFAGVVAEDRLDGLYRRSDVFVLASRYEGYGMAATEAVARGLPVIATLAGAQGEALAGAGTILVEPDDPLALRAALRRMIGDAALRAELAVRSRDAAALLPRWSDTAAVFDRLIGAAR